MKNVHIKEIRVNQNHLDELQHVNNVQFVFWVEEMAKEHWQILKNKTNYAEDFWVLVDHHIQYKKQVFKDDILTIKTYPMKPEGLKQPRKVEFYLNDELAVDSKTLWILIDRNTKKIKRLVEDWLDF